MKSEKRKAGKQKLAPLALENPAAVTGTRRTRLAVGGRLRQLWRVQRDHFADAVLVVLGHGTTLNDQSAAPVWHHAAELRRRKIFAEVRAAFWKQEPQVKKVLAEITAPRVFIVPFFISEGYFSTEIIPQELGFHFPDHLSRATRHCFTAAPSARTT